MNKTYLLLGIGGSGMASLSHILLDVGEAVVGYDAKNSTQIQILRERKVPIFSDFASFQSSQEKDKITHVVYSSAIRNSPFLDWAKSRHLPILHRSQVLHQKMQEKKSISIAGAHGKTTTTGIIAQILLDSGFDPAVMVGGEFSMLGGRGGRWGKGEYGVYESDESDGSFLNHIANYRILTNVDFDHLDYFKTKENLFHAFLRYISPSPNQGISIITALDPLTQEFLQHLEDFQNTILIFPEGSKIPSQPSYKTYTLKMEGNFAYIQDPNQKVYPYTVRFPGDQYLKNASLAIALGFELGIPFPSIQNSLENYLGVKRRMEPIYKDNQFLILDDYGHHPTEIKAVFNSMHQLKIQGKIQRKVVLFQPHRYTRTQQLYKEFAESLLDSDLLFLLPIYPADEEPIPGVSTHWIAEELVRKGKSPHLLTGDIEEDTKILCSYIQEGDGILCLGAGNVYEWGHAIRRERERLLANKC